LKRRALAGGVLWAVTAVSCSAATHGAAPQDGAARVDRPPVADPRAVVCAEIDAGAPVPYAVVQQIFDSQCVTCHAPGADLVLQDAVSWSNLVDRASPRAEACGGTLVVPGDPSSSYLFQKLASSSPCSGLQMPRGELGSEPLPGCVVDLISTWIQEGAPGPVDGGG
jgi:cytochrome c5